jgi:hypothetical protein
MREKKIARIEPTVAAEDAWVKHSGELVEGSMLVEANSWFVGANIPGKARAILLYANPAPKFREKCAQVAANNYEGFELS